MGNRAAAVEVGDGVWRIRHSWGSSWVLARGEEASLIDTGTRWDLPFIRAGLLAACGGRRPRLRNVLLTHAHTDHAGGATQLVREYGGTVACHRDEAPFLQTHRTYVPPGIRGVSPSGFLFAAGELTFPVRRGPVEATFADGDIVDTPVGPLRVVHTPGHTPGHVVYVLDERGWVFSGDALINVIPWRMVVGLSLPPGVFTADYGAMLVSAQAVVDLRPRGLLSGHGPAILHGTAEKLADFAARTIEPRRIRLGAR